MHWRTGVGRGTAGAVLMATVLGGAWANPRALAQVSFDWATVGDPGNAPDTQVMTKGPVPDFTTGYGAVDYTYRIAKQQVTNLQYAEFLNAVDPTGGNTLNLYQARMTTSSLGAAYTGGIDFNAAAGAGAKYSVKSGQSAYPAVWINWTSAARFVNWLANGQGAGATESGVYDMSLMTGGFSTPPPRAEAATVFLPSENEWYKAAYYDPTKGGTGGYWQFGTQSDAAPASLPPPGTANSANLGSGVGSGGAATTLAKTGAAFDSTVDYLTDVGSYSSAESYYGLSDLDGLVYDWTEATRISFGNELPIYRGGSWRYGEGYTGASYRNIYSGAGVPSYSWYGFRIAGLPEAPPVGVVIDVASGTQTQAQAGYPSITTADSVTKTGSGTLIFDAVNSYAGPTVVSAGTLRVASNTGLPATALIVEAGGNVALPQDVRVALGLAGLAVADGAGGGRVDLGAGQLTVAAGGISAADLRADIIAGRNGGGWNGSSGLTSSAAAASGGTRAVGYVVAGDGTAQASFAAPGDTNLNGTVDVFDLVGINSGGKYGAGTAAVWSEGDFNYDGVTNVFDLVGINTAGAYGRGNYFPASPAVAAGVNAVPEPTAWGAVGAGLAALAALLRRRAIRGSLE